MPTSSTAALHHATVAHDDESGKHLLAAKDVPSNHTVCHVQSAYALALHEEYKHAICAVCFAVGEETYDTVCETCERVHYCSKKCRATHYTDGGPGSVPHRHVCAALQHLGPLERQQSLVKPRLVLEVLARRHVMKDGAGAATAEDAQRDVDFKSLMHYPPSWEPAGKAADADADAADKAADKAADADADAEDAAEAKEAREDFGEWCDGLRAALAEVEWAAAVPEDEVSDDELHAMLSRIDVNGFECSVSASLHGVAVACGTGIYLGGATLFNHSCEPNCEVTQAVPSLSVTTTTAVAKGTPLTISYLEHARELGVRHRQARLQAQYGFTCTCARCVADEERLRPRTPWRWLANCHRRGDHYVVAVGMYAAYVPLPLCILSLVLYFFLWTKVFRFPL